MQVVPVSSSNLSVPTAAAGATVAPRWMWAALGALGAGVVALAATVAVQWAGRPSAVVPPSDPAALAAPAAQQGAAAQVAPPAWGGRPRTSAAVPSGPAAPWTAEPAQALSGGTQPTGVSPSRPTCALCGHVESVQALQQSAPPTGVGAVAGGVLGAVVGHQVGKGNGRKAATVLGAVGGGYAGHQIEKNVRKHTVYDVTVRMEDGSARRFRRAEAVAVGTPVILQGQGFRIGSAAPQDSAAYPQPGMVRTGG